MGLLPSFLAGYQGLANFFRSAELAGLCFVPAFVNFAAGIGLGWLLAKDLQRLAADERKLLAQFNQGLQFRLFRFLQKPFVFAVHEFLKTMARLRRKTQISNSLYPVHRRGNC